jgi:hypothetical protein
MRGGFADSKHSFIFHMGFVPIGTSWEGNRDTSCGQPGPVQIQCGKKKVRETCKVPNRNFGGDIKEILKTSAYVIETVF